MAAERRRTGNRDTERTRASWEQLPLFPEVRVRPSERRATIPSPAALVAELPITEVLRRIPHLSRHELASLRRHEREGRSRPLVLSAIEGRMRRS